MTLDVNGKNYNVTGQGQGNLNTVLGALGTASFLGFNGGNFLGGWNNGNCGGSEQMVAAGCVAAFTSKNVLIPGITDD